MAASRRQRRSQRSKKLRRRTCRKRRNQRGAGYLGVPDVSSVPRASIVPVAVGDRQDGSFAFSLLSDNAKHEVDEEELYV